MPSRGWIREKRTTAQTGVAGRFLIGRNRAEKTLTFRRKPLYLQDNFDNLVIFVLFRAQEIWVCSAIFPEHPGALGVY